MKEIKEYLDEGSDGSSSSLETRHLTRLVEQRIVETEANDAHKAVCVST